MAQLPTITVKIESILTKPEINHILSLINFNEQEGTYFGNKVHFEKRTERIKQKLK
jgi:hypothetical protein